MNSLQGGGTATPSPEQVNVRRGPSVEQTSDLPVSGPFSGFERRASPLLVQCADCDSYGTVLRLQSNR
jgi:hypothetical protein